MMTKYEAILKTDDVCKLLSVSQRTLYNWRKKGVGPAYHKIGQRRIFYYQSDIDQWIERTKTTGYL